MTSKKTHLPAPPSDDRELRKTNELISRPLVRGNFTLLGRKVFNAMILHAQFQGEPGKNAPSDAPGYSQMFWTQVSDIARDARYDSNDLDLLKEVAVQLMDIKIISETDTEWTADHLVEQVKIVNPAGLRKKGGRLWLGYRFPQEVMHLVTDPKRYTRLPLYYLTLLKTNAGAALYELAKESAWKTTGLTQRAPWEDWQAILEGKPKSELQGWKSEYKFFKDRVLKKALIEVNTLTDVEVELIEYKTGRKVGDLQFKVAKKQQQTLPFAPPPIIDASLVEKIMSFGILKREAEDLLATNDEGFLRSTCAYVQERVSNKALPAVASSGAFFRSALRGRYAEGVKTKALPKPKPKVDEKPEKEPKADEGRGDAERLLDEMDPVEKEKLLLSFLEANPAIRAMTKGKMTKMVRTLLIGWMSDNKKKAAV
jgi:hypothetical protein